MTVELAELAGQLQGAAVFVRSVGPPEDTTGSAATIARTAAIATTGRHHLHRPHCFEQVVVFPAHSSAGWRPGLEQQLVVAVDSGKVVHHLVRRSYPGESCQAAARAHFLTTAYSVMLAHPRHHF